MNIATRTIFTGDNLDVLRGFNSGCVDLIYLDPPFNSRREYSAPVGSKAAGAAFADTWHWDDVDAAWLGEVADAEPRVAAVVEAAGTVHGRGMKSYLLMMGVRLLELRRVLKPTGSIWLHCDPTANSYLRLLMDAVFGKAQLPQRDRLVLHAGPSGFAQTQAKNFQAKTRHALLLRWRRRHVQSAVHAMRRALQAAVPPTSFDGTDAEAQSTGSRRRNWPA